MSRLKVGIVNVTGYIGGELARLLYRHPEVTLGSVSGRSAAGKQIGEVFPHLQDLDLKVDAEIGGVDVAFLALPHGESAGIVPGLLSRGIKVIDAGADFRLKDRAEYERWYRVTHAAPDLLNEAVYGLVELHRSEIPPARLVASPGCYPTGAILALAPAVKEGLIGPEVIIDSKSGVSGAGRTLTLGTHFAEANENVSAYALEGHRHLPEIVQELGRLAPLPVNATFVPHLIPMDRGILSTCYGDLTADPEKWKKHVQGLYREFYSGETFVKVLSSPPQTKQTLGSNYCLIYPTVDIRTGRLIVVSCLDNLVKGGAGQAVQAMNVMYGFPEETGLGSLAVYP